MSHCGISVIINVRLYDGQDDTDMINPHTSSDCELHCTALAVMLAIINSI